MKHLLAILLNERLMIDEQWLASFIARAEITAESNSDTPAKATLKMPVVLTTVEGDLVNLEDRKVGGIFNDAPEGSVAVISIHGVLTKKGYFDYDAWQHVPGMSVIGQIINEADKAKAISGIVLMIDSPGGTVDGTETLANAVKATTTPIVAYVDGLAASAAYWVASQTDEIVLSGETSGVGSIGTMIALMNADGYFAKFGIQIHRINATDSVDKNRSFLEAREGKYELIRSELLDPVNTVFLNAVKAGRRGDINLKKENVLTGKVYNGQNAVNVGLADAVGNHEKAIEMVSNLAKGNGLRATSLEGERLINATDSDLSLIQNTGTTMKITFSSALKALAAFFKTTPNAEGNHEAEMTADRAAELNARLEAVEAAEARATAAEASLAAIQALAPEATDLVAHFTQVQQERDQYAKGNDGGDAGAKGAKEGDDFGAQPKPKTSWEMEAESKFKKG